MKMFYMVSLSVFGIAGIVPHLTANQAQSQVQSQQPGAAPFKFVIRPPKKLHDSMMKVLNDQLYLNPTCTLRTEYACNFARKTLQELPTMSEDKALVVSKVHSLLSSLKQFFKQIHDFAFLIRPLLRESLFGEIEAQARKEFEKQNIADKQLQLEKLLQEIGKNSVLLGFLDSDVHDKDIFFERRVQTKEALENVCAEFIIFFGDLMENLSTEARNEYLRVRKQFIKSKN